MSNSSVQPLSAIESDAQQLACDLARALGSTAPPPIPGGSTAARVVYWLRPLEAVARELVESAKSSRAQLVETQQELAAVQLGLDSALRLQRVFTAHAETREARALHNYASTKLELRVLQERIASAISKGTLPANFYETLPK